MQVCAAALAAPAVLARRPASRPARPPTAYVQINMIAGEPRDPALGDIWLNPATYTWHVFNGARWLKVPD